VSLYTSNPWGPHIECFANPRELKKFRSILRIGRKCVGDGIRARGGMWPMKCVSARVEALPGPTRSCVWLRPAPAACDPPVSTCLRSDYNEWTMRGKTGAMADRASACCACSVRLLRAIVRHRRTQRNRATQAASRAAFRVRRREDGTELDAPVPVLPTALHCAGRPGFQRVSPLRCTRHCTLLFATLGRPPPPCAMQAFSTMSRTVLCYKNRTWYQV
jgi:hypothetical protein